MPDALCGEVTRRIGSSDRFYRADPCRASGRPLTGQDPVLSSRARHEPWREGQRLSPASSRHSPEGQSRAPERAVGGESWRVPTRRTSPRATTPISGHSGSSPSFQRTLGFLSNFAVAFSYISVSTGTFTNQAVAFGVGGPAIFWAWPLVILGQTFVALNFAELSSHFPVAGSIYQWSKRLSNKTLGWFTGWIYFWAGRHHGRPRSRPRSRSCCRRSTGPIELADPSPIPGLDMLAVHRARRA